MEFTQLLEKAKAGDHESRAAVIQAVYDDLRRMAASQMRGRGPGDSLSATVVVHEVTVRLMEGAQLRPENRQEFLAFAAKAMRNYLIDHARSKSRKKRGGDRKKIQLDEVMEAAEHQPTELLELHEALNRLAEVDPRKSQVVEMRYFAGMSVPETASALDISAATVKRDWEVARLWLLRELNREEPDGN